MKPFGTLQNNPLKTRDDFLGAFIQLTNPLKPYYSKGSARLHIGNACAHYPSEIAEMEGFSRVLWGLAPLLAGGFESDLTGTYLDGIRHGTDPNHAEYWGEVGDYDQRLVEMAALGFALMFAPEHLWEPLSYREKENFAAWLNQINHHKLCDCNWLLFNVLVNMGLKNVGAHYNQKRMEECLDRVGEFYLENGWYADGVNAHCDYYTSFAIHFYSLLYAKFMEKDDPARSALFKKRADEFAKEFIYWFAPNGEALPYGRSLTYRFAQSAFWGALAFAGSEAFSTGIIKGILLRSLRWWFKQAILSRDEILTIGYAYENLVMAEGYNSPGSPYWALKSFLPLMFPENHPFWQAEELPLPPLEPVHIQKEAHFILCRENSHLTAFSSGYTFFNGHTQCVPKYEKFAYSTLFGLSVPRGAYGLSQGAYDSMLALSDGEDLFRVKKCSQNTEIRGGRLQMQWKPWEDVTVNTTILPGLPWHIRIHRIQSARKLIAADGGFALGLDGVEGYENAEETGAVLTKTVKASSGILCLLGGGKPELIYPNSNTNLMNPRTVLPTVRLELEVGGHLLVTAVYGQSGQDETGWKEKPHAEIKNGCLEILFGEKLVFTEKLNG